MKQLFQSLKDGKLELLETPLPTVGSNTLLVQSRYSLISIGTERMLHKFGSSNILSKVKQQPDKVKMVIDKIKTDGLFTVLEMVKQKLDEPIPIGYSNVGVVKEIGKNVDQFRIGDRVVSASPHAEYVRALKNLTAKIPDNVSDEEAVFAVPGAISLNAIRLLNAELGKTFVVVGLGLLGQLALQILDANGCRAIGFDVDPGKVNLADSLGYLAFDSFEKLKEHIHETTAQTGVDGVLIAASTHDEMLINTYSDLCRKRGVVVLLGVAPIQINRDIFYKKELSFHVASAYGPGRYDPVYEDQGMDYPIAYVRWTAKRNMEAFLHLLQWKKLHLKPLISKTISFDKSLDEYPKVLNDSSVIGAIFQYSCGENLNKTVINSVKPDSTSTIQIGYIGSGNFSKMILLPILKKNQIPIRTIYSSDGASAAILAKKYNIYESTSDPDRIFANEDINTVFIATRHHTHFKFAKKAIENKKHIFVEKPLVMNWEELEELSQILRDYHAVLMVGFNRRFSPLIQKLKQRLLHRAEPVAIEIMVNAGEIPPEHWVHDPEIGGTRIIGELCHFIDLARFIADASIENINAMSLKNHPVINYDKLTVSMNFSDGSIANINYLANGSKKFPKERIEVFYRNKIFQINNFKNLISFGDSLKLKLKKQDKGHEGEVREFIQCIRDGKSSPIPVHELLEVHAATLAINDVNNHFKTINLPELMNLKIRK